MSNWFTENLYVFFMLSSYIILYDFQTGMHQKYEASAMISQDGETIAFVAQTALEGPVEVELQY